MEPDYYSPLTSFPLELKEDHQLMINLNQASSSSPASCHSFFEPVQQQEGFYHMESHLLQHSEEGKKFFSQAGSCDSPGSGSGIKRNENHQCDQNSSVKWMSSKMRLMKKMMNSDAAAANNSCMKKLEDQIQKQPPSSSLETDRYNSYSSNNNSTNTNTIIRVCADCNTTKTPLWRGGPKGPKSLCNACGIRQRKARRAAAAAAATAAAAAAAANGTAVQLTADASSNKKSRVQDKDKTSSPSNNNNSCLPFKKRCKFNSNNSPSHGKKNNLCFEDLTLILSKNSSALQRVFPQDEKEAAILLMALSHGLVHG